MDPNELIKAAPELAKAATAVSAAVPFTGIVKRMLGPAADELAEMLRDRVRLYRYERQIKCLEKAERMAKEAGFTAQPVPPKILFPLLEGASFEEDENLHNMWAALLANAASPDHRGSVRPAFIAILKQMAADEAALLNWLFSHTTRASHEITAGHKTIDHREASPIPEDELARAYFLDLGFQPKQYSSAPTQIIESLSALDQFQTCIHSLIAAQLLTHVSDYVDVNYTLSPFGVAFLGTCRPPKPNENG